MKKEIELLPKEKIMNLFTLFFLGTLSFILYKFSSIPEFRWKGGFLFGLFLFSVLTYEFVLISIITYYSIKGSKKLIISFNKNKKKYILSIEIFLGLTFVMLDTIYSNSVLVFFRDSILAMLMICAMPPSSEYIKKLWKEKIKNNKKTKKNKLK